MKKLVLLALLLSAGPAFGATTWSADTSTDLNTLRVSKAVCTTGSETKPADGATTTIGLALFGLKGITVQVEAAGAMTVGGKFLAYVQNSISGKWLRMPDVDLTVGEASDTYATPAMEISSDWDRLIFVPSGVGQAVTIYVKGRRLASGR
jgi:hypothetical protein